jgi:tetratricopeptide (TPR) repeat protein
MYFFLLLLGAAPAVVMKYIIKFFPAGLHLLLYGLAQSYYMIVSYHLMGYVILQYHEEVGYEVDFDDFRDPSLETAEPEKIDPDAVILKEVNPMIQDGNLDEAISAIKDMTRKDGIASVDLSDRYYKLLKMKKRTSEMLEHGINHLDLLAADNNKPKAVEVYTECRKIEPKFLPSPVFLLKLAGWLNEAGKTKEAVGIYNSLVKAYPKNHLTPKAYFRAAQIIHDRLMNPEKARKILNSLISKYPDNEIVPHVKNYIANM